MRAVRIVVCPLALVIVLLSAASSAFCANPWSEAKIVSGGSANLGLPQIWGNTVYYYSSAAINQADVWVWDSGGGARLLIGGSGYQAPLAVYGSSLVFTRLVNGKFSLYLYDQVNGERLITTTAGDSGHYPTAAIYGNTVVYEDIRSGVPQIYTWDPVDGERQIAPTSYAQTNPRISGNTVVWEDARNGSGWSDIQLHRWSATDGVDHAMGYFNSPAIYQNHVFAFDYTPQYPQWDGIWRVDLTTGVKTHLYQTSVSWENYPYAQAWGDIYVGGGASIVGPGNIWAWDPVNGLTKVNQSAGTMSAASIYGHQVAWSDGQDIYIDTFAPEPSALCALVLGLAGMCGSILRSRRRRNSP